MPTIVIPQLEDEALTRLRDRAAASGRSVEEEAKVLLEDALKSNGTSTWANVTAIRDRLAASGRQFTDSAEDIHEDRER